MALKTFKNLHVGNTVYYVRDGEICETKVNMMSLNEVHFQTGYTKKYNELDETSHTIKVVNYINNRASEKVYYLNKVSALKERSKFLQNQIQELFEKQRYFLENLTKLNNELLENNLEIVEEKS